jgi:hypothetical protein
MEQSKEDEENLYIQIPAPPSTPPPAQSSLSSNQAYKTMDEWLFNDMRLVNFTRRDICEYMSEINNVAELHFRMDSIRQVMVAIERGILYRESYPEIYKDTVKRANQIFKLLLWVKETWPTKSMPPDSLFAEAKG